MAKKNIPSFLNYLQQFATQISPLGSLVVDINRDFYSATVTGNTREVWYKYLLDREATDSNLQTFQAAYTAYLVDAGLFR